ncbi:MAG: sugar nucleotide-binding protein [Bradyrhizobium sp.]|nr:sugar nucleotide-binding protein [Bradyrhizobium sp.]
MRCLIVGVDSSFGGALSRSLARLGHGVVATTRRPGHAGDHLLLDLAGPLPPLPEADVAIICAAISRLEDCRRHPELAHRINVAAPLELGRSLAQTGARVILPSTSSVFGCVAPHVEENARLAPRSAYARLKAEAEARLLELGSSVSVLRLTKVVRPNVGLLSDWIRQLGQGKTVRAFDDCRFAPLTVEHVVDAITAMVERGESGVYHASGARDISYAEAAAFLAQRVGVASGLVEPVHGADSELPCAELASFTSLATDRLSRLMGFAPPEPLDVLQKVYGPEMDSARQMATVQAG